VGAGGGFEGLLAVMLPVYHLWRQREVNSLKADPMLHPEVNIRLMSYLLHARARVGYHTHMGTRAHVVPARVG